MLESVDLTIALPDRSNKPLLRHAPLIRILEDVSLRIEPGQAVGVVGESGSGKSTLGKTLLGLYQPVSGKVLFEGRDLWSIPAREIPSVRRKVQMIFQDSQSSLNPRQRLVDILSAPFVANGIAPSRKARHLAIALIERVGLTQAHASRYPHELSGGQRQRVGIARAIALRPAYIVADEIVSGLDVSVQAQILALLRELRAQDRLGIIFISHDLSVVRSLCDGVAVMQGGVIVERGDCKTVFENPRHPYTQSLLRSIPSPTVDRQWLGRSASPS